MKKNAELVIVFITRPRRPRARLDSAKRACPWIFIFSLILFNITGAFAESPQVTIYNGGFGVIKERFSLELKKGENEVRFTDITAHMEPESIILRDIKKPDSVLILEQNYESDPLSEGLLLMKNEGKEIMFEIQNPKTGEKEIKKAKIIRSGYVPHQSAYGRYGQEYYVQQQAMAYGGAGTPIVEMDGKIMFNLPGRPVFENLDPGNFLKPTLLWQLWADKSGTHDMEISYISGGMKWEATYNAVAPAEGNVMNIIGWVTLDNQSGKEFKDANVKLMAGDVRKVSPEGMGIRRDEASKSIAGAPPAVTEKEFAEYHLYTLDRRTTLRDREIKQVEFIRADNVTAERLYVYDGTKIGERYQYWDYSSIRNNAEYGTECNPKVWVMMEFKNSKENNLGMPLPKGKVKLYQRDEDGRNEFIGEDVIDHTPKDETIRLYIGNAFDIVGERRRTNYRIDNSHDWCDESFEITVRNHKKEEITVRVVEHLYRWINWDITAKTDEFKKIDSRTIEFPVKVPKNGEKKITYSVHYSW